MNGCDPSQRMLRLFGIFHAPTKQISQLLDSERFTPADKAQVVLGFQARDISATILETAAQIESLGQSR